MFVSPRDGLEGMVTSGAGRNQVFGARLSERRCGRHSSLSLHLQRRGWNVDQGEYVLRDRALAISPTRKFSFFRCFWDSSLQDERSSDVSLEECVLRIGRGGEGRAPHVR